jgi:hypothetical protein
LEVEEVAMPLVLETSEELVAVAVVEVISLVWVNWAEAVEDLET